jgi:glycosyltransferase involved in cell wall biosynthesis
LRMKIAFFGAWGAFDYFRIGGTESFARRLVGGLREAGVQADYVIYGAGRTGRLTVPPGVDLYYFTGLGEALQHLAGHYQHIVTIYLRPKDRLPYMYFRRRHQQRLTCHLVFFGWPDSLLHRKAAFLEARLYPFNGRLFCISPRIWRYVKGWSDKALMLLPPVPESYFLSPEDKTEEGKIRVTYVGRTDPGKGIEDVINLFTWLQDSPEVEVEIYGFHRRDAKVSARINEWLCRQETMRYHYTDYDGYTPETEVKVRRILRDTDILVLPYQRLSSTIDTPLLLLEGMAALCAVATRPLGDLPSIYGPSPFLFSGPDGLRQAVQVIQGARGIMPQERQRIMARNREIGFGTKEATALLLDALT